jgi:hypothetical protein
MGMRPISLVVYSETTGNIALMRHSSQVEFAGGALRCGEYITVRKIGDSNQKVTNHSNHHAYV